MVKNGGRRTPTRRNQLPQDEGRLSSRGLKCRVSRPAVARWCRKAPNKPGGNHATPVLCFAALAAVLSCALPAAAETIIDEWPSVKAPPAPQLKPVTLEAKTTALILIDIIKQTCNTQRRPRCVAPIPHVKKLLDEARAKGVFVIYALFPSPSPATFPDPKITDYVTELAPKGDEPVVTAFVAKFNLGGKDTGLEKILKDKGIKTFRSSWCNVAQRRSVHIGRRSLSRFRRRRSSGGNVRQ